MVNPQRHISLMGIVNLTEDSYYAPSRCSSVEATLDRVRLLVDEGADIIDIGACSSRPGSVWVGAEEEWSRLEPVLEKIRTKFPEVSISLDTCWSSVVRKAYEAIGKFIVNDISASEADSDMLPTVGELELDYIAMHMRGNPQNMQEFTQYGSVTDDVISYFRDFSERAISFGVSRWILDPGFGFSKTEEQNYRMLSELERFKEVRCGDGTVPAVLVGVSRKSMIYKKFSISADRALPATQVLHLAALQNGADILRVHDVAEAAQTIALYRCLAKDF